MMMGEREEEGAGGKGGTDGTRKGEREDLGTGIGDSETEMEGVGGER